MKDVRRTYREMVIAIIIQGILYCVAGGILTGQYIVFPVSIVIGCAVAIGLLGHMMRSITVIVELEPNRAKGYGARQSVIRIAMMGLVLCIAVYYADYISPWGVLLGMLSLKFSAYLQPLVHKVVEKTEKVKGRKKNDGCSA